MRGKRGVPCAKKNTVCRLRRKSPVPHARENVLCRSMKKHEKFYKSSQNCFFDAVRVTNGAVFVQNAHFERSFFSHMFFARALTERL